MSAPIIPVPLYPSVPSAPGVPAIARSPLGAVNQIVGDVTARLTSDLGAFSGSLVGQLIQSDGAPSVIGAGLLTGVIDSAGNIAGTLSGAIGAQITGAFTGSISDAGLISGSLSGVATQLSGEVGQALTGDSVTSDDGQQSGQWGIFDSGGAQVLTADNVISLEYRNTYQIPRYPIEKGAFESYNKVKEPFDARLVMTRGGDQSDRTAFLDALDTLAASLDLYTVTSPEKSYSNANITHVDYDRSARRGAALITAEVWLQEVRVANAPEFSSTQQPSGAAQVDDGNVQAQEPSTSNFDMAKRALRSEIL